MSSIGISQNRIDALDKVTGKADYSGDLVHPEMLSMLMATRLAASAAGRLLIFLLVATMMQV